LRRPFRREVLSGQSYLADNLDGGAVFPGKSAGRLL